jgi:phage gpG-like protein
MIELTIERDDVSPFLHVMANSMSDFTEPLTMILQDALGQAARRVAETKGPGPEGELWAPPAKGTRYGPGQSLLERSGAMLDSLVPQGPGNFFEVSPTEGRAGSLIPYAAFQQFGTGRIPPRPFLGWDLDRLPQYDAWIWTHIFSGMPEEPRFG